MKAKRKPKGTGRFKNPDGESNGQVSVTHDFYRRLAAGSEKRKCSPLELVEAALAAKAWSPDGLRTRRNGWRCGRE